VIDISTPSAPTKVGSLSWRSEITYVDTFIVQGNYLYALTGVTALDTDDDSLVVIDISTPSSPTFDNELSEVFREIGVSVTFLNDHVYAVSWDSPSDATSAITPIDVSTPTAPSAVASTADPEMSFVVTDGTSLYTSHRDDRKITWWDASTPSSLVSDNTLIDSVRLLGMQKIHYDGGYIFCPGDQGVLTVVDTAERVVAASDTNPTYLTGSLFVNTNLPTVAVATVAGVTIYRFV